MDNSMSIRKTTSKDGYCITHYIEVEEIENGFLVTKRTEKYSEEGDYPMREEKQEVKKKYYEKNPLDANAVWDKVEF